MSVLLTGWLGFGLPQLVISQPGIKPSITVYLKKTKFQRLCSPLDAKLLLAMYRPQLQLVMVFPRPFTPDIKDSVFASKFAPDSDRMEIRASPRPALSRADFKSDKLEFGQGIRVGCSKNEFCRVFRQNPKYNAFTFAASPARDETLTFHFQENRLVTVRYFNQQIAEEIKFLKARYE